MQNRMAGLFAKRDDSGFSLALIFDLSDLEEECRSALHGMTALVGDDLYLHGGDAAPNHVQTGCRFAGYVENPAFFDGAAIIDAHQKVTSVGEVGYPDDSPERQETMGSREGLLVVAFAVGGFSAVKLVAVERGFPGIKPRTDDRGSGIPPGEPRETGQTRG